MRTVCIFSHNQVTHDISAIHCSSNYMKSAVYVDTDIRLTKCTKCENDTISIDDKVVRFKLFNLVLKG